MALISRVRRQLEKEFKKITFGFVALKYVSYGPGTQMFTMSTQLRKSKVLLKNIDVCGQTQCSCEPRVGEVPRGCVAMTLFSV